MDWSKWRWFKPKIGCGEIKTSLFLLGYKLRSSGFDFKASIIDNLPSFIVINHFELF